MDDVARMNRNIRVGLRRRFGFAATALVLASTAAIFHRILFAGEWLGSRDAIRVSLPLAKFWRDQVSAGNFPEWYPYDGLGQPFVGMMLTGAFHPSRLIDLLLPIPHSVSANTLLAYPIAAVGTYLSARTLFKVGRHGAVFAAISYAFCGYLVSISNSLPYLTSAASLPLTLWAMGWFARVRTAGALLVAGLLTATVLFTGDVLGFSLCVSAAALIGLLHPDLRGFRQRVVVSAALVGVTTALAAPQLLPALSLIVQREHLLIPAVAQRFSFLPLRILEFPWGPLFASGVNGFVPQTLAMKLEPEGRSLWTDSVAIGPLAFTFAMAAAVALWLRTTPRVLAGVVALLLVLSFGRFTPVYEWFFRVVPLWRTFRYPEKLLPTILLIAALAAGWAVHTVTRSAPFRRRTVKLLFAFAAGSLVIALLEPATQVWSRLLDLRNAAVTQTMSGNFTRLLLQSALFAALAAGALTRLRGARLAWLLCVVQALSAVAVHVSIPQTISVPLLTEPTPFVELLRERGATSGGARVESAVRAHGVPDLPLSVREKLAAGSFAALVADTQALFDLETSAAYLPAATARVTVLQADPQQWFDQTAPVLGTGFQCVEAAEAKRLSADPRFRPVHYLAEWGLILVERLDALPRVYLARPLCARDTAEALSRMKDGAFAPGDEVVVECGDPAPVATNAKGPVRGTAELVTYSAERVVVRTRADEAATLVLNDAYADGWEAFVDGAPVPILPANGAVRSVALQPGTHAVTFEYRQPGLRPGLLLAGTTVIALLGAFLLQRRRRLRSVDTRR